MNDCKTRIERIESPEGSPGSDWKIVSDFPSTFAWIYSVLQKNKYALCKWQLGTKHRGDDLNSLCSMNWDQGITQRNLHGFLDARSEIHRNICIHGKHPLRQNPTPDDGSAENRWNCNASTLQSVSVSICTVALDRDHGGKVSDSLRQESTLRCAFHHARYVLTIRRITLVNWYSCIDYWTTGRFYLQVISEREFTMKMFPRDRIEWFTDCRWSYFCHEQAATFTRDLFDNGHNLFQYAANAIFLFVSSLQIYLILCQGNNH